MPTSRLPLLTRSGAALALAITLALAGCGGAPDGDANAGDAKDGEAAAAAENGEAPAPKAEAVPVEVAAVARRPISASYSGTANLEAPAEAQVVAKTSGVMLQLLAEEGDQVKAGQVLARIDPDRPRVEL